MKDRENIWLFRVKCENGTRMNTDAADFHGFNQCLSVSIRENLCAILKEYPRVAVKSASFAPKLKSEEPNILTFYASNRH